MRRYATHSDGSPRRGPHHPNAKRGPLGCDRITRHSGNCRKDGPICAKRARATFRSTAQRVLRPSVPDRLVPRTVRPEACEAHALADSVERTSVTPPLRHRPQGRGAFLLLARSRPAREAAPQKSEGGLGCPLAPFSRARKATAVAAHQEHAAWPCPRSSGRNSARSSGPQQRQLPRCATACA